MRTAHQTILENDRVANTLTRRTDLSRADVMDTVCRHLAPFQIGERPIIGSTVISKDLAIDSLAIMDMVMELEDHYDISIPMSLVAEIYTVDQLSDAILKLRAQR